MRVRALWQCALSCTIRVRLSSEPQELIVATIHISEKYTGFQKGMTDNFVTWSKKVMKIAEPNASAAKVATALASKSISYAGANTSKQMILAAQTITANLDETCYADLRMLEREFGRDILTAGYITLPKLIQTCKGMLDTQSLQLRHSDDGGHIATATRDPILVHVYHHGKQVGGWGKNSWMDRNDGCEEHGGQAPLLSHEDHGQ